jgi:hypothetical protein
VAYNSLLVSEQNGFRRGISTEKSALKLINGVFFCSNKKIFMFEEISVTGQRLFFLMHDS